MDIVFMGIAKRITPPLVWDVARRLFRRPRRDSAVAAEEQPADFYDRTFEEAAHWKRPYYESHYYPLWCVVADRIRLGKVRSVLDLGCGPGQLARLLADNGLERYVGVDFSSKRIEAARQVCPEYAFYAADFFETDLFSTLDYDCVLAMEVLEHIHEDARLLGRIAPGTRFIGSVPNFPARAHVRYFQTAEEVRQRYGSQFSALRVDTIRGMTAGKLFFLLDGTTL